MNQRISWLDVAKGIVIVLMVIGHTSIPEPLSKYIWSFHMPFFFVVSGLLYNEQKYQKFIDFFFSRTQSLMIPYILMTVVVMSLLWIIDCFRTSEIYNGWGGYPLWFVPVLFMSEVCAYLILKGINQNKRCVLYIWIGVLILFGYFLSMRMIYLPYKVEVVPLATGFYLCGWGLKKRVLSMKFHTWFLMLLITLHIMLSQILPKLDMCYNIYGTILNVVNALLGTIAVMGVSMLIDSSKRINFIKRVFIWCGQNTLCIMGFASVLIIFMNDALSHFAIPAIYLSLAKHILLWVILYYLSVLLNNYLPIMVGKKKSR